MTMGSAGPLKECGGHSTNFGKLYKNAAFTLYSSATWPDEPTLVRTPRMIAQEAECHVAGILAYSTALFHNDKAEVIHPPWN